MRSGDRRTDRDSLGDRITFAHHKSLDQDSTEPLKRISYVGVCVRGQLQKHGKELNSRKIVRTFLYF